MNVRQLIEALMAMPPDAEVRHLWDGAPRTTIQHVWLALDGYVVTSDVEEPCYYAGARPASAPGDGERWSTPKVPT